MEANSGSHIITEYYPGRYTKYEAHSTYVDITTETDSILRIQFLGEEICRVRYATEHVFPADFSYAIDGAYAWPTPDLDYTEDDDVLELSTSKLTCRITKEDLKITFLNADGEILSTEEKGFHWEEHSNYGGDIVQMSKKVQPGESFFGLGDKPSSLNLRGKRIVNWGTDEYGFNKDQDPIYKNIPFYIGAHGTHTYGVFFDNSFKSFFDFASERNSVASFWAMGGEMNYYFIFGSDPIRVVENYTNLTGRPELPPIWALGYHQCKWSYYPEAMVREVCSKFRDLKIPCDAIYLDIDYMDGFRCFTWDHEKFPQPAQMISDLEEDGFKTVTMIDPGIKVDPDYWVYQEAIEKNYFCRRADGPLMKGKVWPGDCHFPDFTHKKVRQWWSGLYKEMIADVGVHGVWNDMNEPALFEIEGKTFPKDVRHDYDGHPCSHRKAHNVYGMQMARATYHGVKQYTFPNRPFVITRSVYSGGQRYCCAWTGDNIATWEHLWIANVQCQRMSVSGFSFIGTDIGGFIEQPTPELYIRWIQLAIFHPFFRTHSSGDHGDQEPWSFGPLALDIARTYIELRYRLLPYIYTAFYQYTKHGTPMLRPLAFAFFDDKDTHHRQDEFLMGDHILACPVLAPNSQGRFLYLPKGRWYNIWTEVALEGPLEQWVDAKIDQMPIFVREGAIIPTFPTMQYTGEKSVEELTLHVFHKLGEEISLIYEDSGQGYDYEHGASNEKSILCKGTSKSIELLQRIDGQFKPSYRTSRLLFHGLPFQPKFVKVNDKVVNNPKLTLLDSGLWEYRVKQEFRSISLKA